MTVKEFVDFNKNILPLYNITAVLQKNGSYNKDDMYETVSIKHNDFFIELFGDLEIMKVTFEKDEKSEFGCIYIRFLINFPYEKEKK